jgi:hypothetical protein
MWLVVGTPIIHAVASLLNVAYRITLLITLIHFRAEEYNDQGKLKPFPFKVSLILAGTDFIRIFTTPLVYVALELAAIYGVVSPYNGRKLYASLERAQYGDGILAPCFQPEATKHLFGGDINKQNAW